jgi:hypothetical protein
MVKFGVTQYWHGLQTTGCAKFVGLHSIPLLKFERCIVLINIRVFICPIRLYLVLLRTLFSNGGKLFCKFSFFHNILGHEKRRKIWGFHGGDYEGGRLLGYKNPVCTSQETHYVFAAEPSRLMLRKMWVFHGGDSEECRLLGCSAVWFF